MKFQMTVVLDCEDVNQANTQFAGMIRDLRNAYAEVNQSISFGPIESAQEYNRNRLTNEGEN